jgi:hypothetical protein
MDFQEYPKWIPVGDGLIVWSREEEEAHQIKEPEPKKRGRPKKVEHDEL